VKPLIEISIDNYNALLRYASETSALYLTLKNAVKTETNTISILCDLYEAEVICAVAKHSCPDAIPQIEKAIRRARVSA
jgi:hypothetical protein